MRWARPVHPCSHWRREKHWATWRSDRPESAPAGREHHLPPKPGSSSIDRAAPSAVVICLPFARPWHSQLINLDPTGSQPSAVVPVALILTLPCSPISTRLNVGLHLFIEDSDSSRTVTRFNRMAVRNFSCNISWNVSCVQSNLAVS